MTYLLFGGKTYYAEGGMNDFIGLYDTALQAIKDGDRLITPAKGDTYGELDWYHVACRETLTVIHRGGVEEQ